MNACLLNVLNGNYRHVFFNNYCSFLPDEVSDTCQENDTCQERAMQQYMIYNMGMCITRVCVYIYIYIHTCMYIYICICTYMYYRYMRVCIYIYIYISIHVVYSSRNSRNEEAATPTSRTLKRGRREAQEAPSDEIRRQANPEIYAQ